MYTLIIVVSLFAGAADGGITLTSQSIPVAGSLEECNREGAKAVKDLNFHQVSNSDIKRNTVVRFTCIKTK